MINKGIHLAVCILFLLPLTGCKSSSPTLPQPTQETITLALVNGTLIDGTGSDPIENAVLLISGDHIAAAGAKGKFLIPPGVKTLDLAGATILPGFINSHVHGGFNEGNLAAWARGGVTTVRDESASPGTVENYMVFQKEINADPKYARLISAGSMIGVPGGYGQRFITSVEEARQVVLEEYANGIKGIKISLEDGYAGVHGLPKLTPEEIKVIVETAHEKGLPVSAHITQAAYLQALLDAGVNDIAHNPYDPIPDKELQQMVDQGVSLVPTFTVYNNYGVSLSALIDNLQRFVELGGQVALGNDYGGGPGKFELGIPMFEIEEMAKSGMTPMQIIVASTKNAAHVLNMDSELGTLVTGKKADVLIVNGNPLNDLHALADVRMVIHNGVIIRDGSQ